MKNIDKEVIVKKTYEKIGYYNYLEELKISNKRNKKVLAVICIVFAISICAVTVKALSNIVLLPLGKNNIKVNGENAEAEIYEKMPEVIFSKCEGDYRITTSGKCIDYNPNPIENVGGTTICYPLETEFENIEIFYDKNDHYCGFHITGISTEGHFEDYLKDCH